MKWRNPFWKGTFKAGVISLLVFSFINPSFAQSETKRIRLGLFDHEYPPYLMAPQNGRQGIVGDAFVEISKILGYKTTIIVLPKKRAQLELENGTIDAIASALEWKEHTPGSIWSNEIIKVSDNVVMLETKQNKVQLPDHLIGKEIALMEGFTYPALETFIQDGSITTSRMNSHANLLRMVDKGRVDFGILDENVAKWSVREEKLNFENALSYSRHGFDEVGYRLIMNSEQWRSFINQFNKALSKMKSDGSLDRILDKYR